LRNTNHPNGDPSN